MLPLYLVMRHANGHLQKSWYLVHPNRKWSTFQNIFFIRHPLAVETREFPAGRHECVCYIDRDAQGGQGIDQKANA